MTCHDEQLVFDYEIGDLVRLAEDHNLEVGYGIITEIKENFEDVYDLDYLRKKIGTLRETMPAREDDFFPSRPQILVLWTIKKTKTNNNISIWMYAEEIAILQKVVKDTK
jgi:hypothetical protein